MPTFLLEVGTEELPATFVHEAIAQWRSRIPQSLAEHGLTKTAIHVNGTPRRLAVTIDGLPVKQSDREEEIKGPPASAAFKDGQPTKAAEGFAKKQGVELDALEVRPTDKGDFVFVRKNIPGRLTAEILCELAPHWITSLEGKRLMRWANGELKFPRPIRWLVAMWDKEVLPIALVNASETIQSDRFSYGHRVLHPEAVEIPLAHNYHSFIRSAFVEIDPNQRKVRTKQQVEAAARKLKGYADISPDLLQEVIHLVEWPNAAVGKFDEEFLILPPEVIITVMVKHQRYFPVMKSKENRELLPYFITISNGDPSKAEIIARGNERVIRARLADAEFFYKSDLAKPLESYVPQLEKVTFQEDLGSVRQKVERLSRIAELIADQLKLNESQSAEIQRAALLCKADLVTQMVYEFPELQGVMGSKYAKASGETEAVSVAIIEHYLPKGASDSLPQTLTGQVVGLADRLDTLVSIFGLGMLPTGSSDPFALRRAANAIINVTWAADLTLNLQQLLEKISADFTLNYPKASPDLLQQLREFFLQRIRTLLQEERGIDYDLVNAVLGENDPEYAERALRDLLDARDRAVFLQEIRKNGILDKIYETVNRSARLAKQGELDTAQLEPTVVQKDRFQKPSEQAFYDEAIVQLVRQTQKPLSLREIQLRVKKMRLAKKGNLDTIELETTVVQKELFQKASEQAFYEAIVQLVPQTQKARAERDYQLLVNAIVDITPTVSTFFDGPESVLVMDENLDIRRNRLNLLGLLRNHARVLADFGAIVKN